MPVPAHGKMYKRDTFGFGWPLLGTRGPEEEQNRKRGDMKKRVEEVRAKMIVVRLNKGEYQRLQKLQGRTTERCLSTYLRKVALNKPVTVKIRNASADDFLEQMLPLQALLEQTCNTYTKAVDRLQVLHKVPELNGWLLLHESTRAALLEQVSHIESLTLQLYEQWLRK